MKRSGRSVNPLVAQDDRRLVYSTDGSLPLPKREKRKSSAPVGPKALPDDGVIRVLREKRRASAVTVVHGLSAGEADAVGKELRRMCGTGGTVKHGIVELQGDHRDTIVAYFLERGRSVKRAGG